MAYGIVIAAFLAGQAGASVPPQVPARSSAPVYDRSDAEPDDIVVEGYRERPDLATRVVPPADTSGRISRTKYEYSERIAKCAARGRLSSPARLRAVVDGEVNTASFLTAQDRLVRIYITCSESPQLLSFAAPEQNPLDVGFAGFQTQEAGPDPFAGVRGYTDPAPLGRSIYDRGAFTIQALKLFAPDLRLTRKDTGDREVQSRFNLREMPRNRFRLPADYRYFTVAVCMARVQPNLAVRLALSDGSARLSDLQAALIDRARVCVGGAKNVRVDPTQFRLYIADAVYRWAVAAKGVDTLIPDNASADISHPAGSSPS